jgi:hypothetical protein
MSIHIEWHDEGQTILIQTYKGDWTINDYIDVVNRTFNLIDPLSHPVDVIADMTCSGRNPVHFISAGPYIRNKISPNQHMIVVVGANEFIRKMGVIAQRMAPHVVRNMHFVNTLDEAFLHIDYYQARQG